MLDTSEFERWREAAEVARRGAHPSSSPGAHYGSEDAEQALVHLGTVLRFVDDLWAKLAQLARQDRHGT